MRISVLVLLAACSSSAKHGNGIDQKAPDTKCPYVADHLLSLLTEQAQAAPTDELDRVRAFFNQRCKEDGWTLPAQECFLGLTKKEEVDRCAEQLTEAQRAALNAPPSDDRKQQGSASAQ